VGIEVRIYNSLQKFVSQPRFTLDVDGEVTVAKLVQQLKIDGGEIFVAFKNGTPLGRGYAAAAETTVGDGDILALSGPIPFSWGYGAPVC
jgi:sulfur carrier protein ThiS